MRITKEAQERREEILDAADEFFGLKGYDRTSTKDILEKVNIARGTLYYHFKSKEDIMDALIERYNARLISDARDIAYNKNIPVNQRISGVIKAFSIGGGSGEEIMKQIHKPQNALMHQKIQKVIIKNMTPLLTEIIKDGIEQGLFITPFPHECMEMIVIYANTVFDSDLFDLNAEDRASRVWALIFNLERMLGVKEGDLSFAMNIFEE